MKKNNKRIIIAGGGTGGHIFPALAIANALKKQDPQIEILFVGARGKMEMEKVPQAGYQIKGLVIAGYNRSSLIKNIWLPFKLIYSFFQVAKIFRSFHPAAVIGVGGYSSFPVLKYAQAKGIKTFLHESNSFAGKTNMMLGKKATRVFTASEGMEKFFPAEKILVTGNPVRYDIARNPVPKEQALDFFGLRAGPKTVLVIGGSLGAKSINEAIAARLDEIEKNGLQLIWQTGKLFNSEAYTKNAGTGKVVIKDFISEMDKAYAAADIVISRSGAMAIAELCIVKKPVIFVPYPFAAEDHQVENAQRLVAHHAAVMIKDSEAKDKLFDTIIQLAADTGKQNELVSNIGKLAIDNADEVIALEIRKTIEK